MPKKVNAAERMLNLLALLSVRSQPITLRQIRQELRGQYSDNEQASRAQFERDKGDLRDLGIPIETVVLGGDQAGETAYKVTRNNYELSDANFTPAEVEALQIAAATVRLAANESEVALWKLGAERVKPSIGPRVTIGFSDPHLEVILDAIAKRAPLTFVYKGDERIVDTYGMLARKGFWYLVGFDHLRKAQRVFRVDRIEGDVEVGKAKSYTIPKGLNIAKAVPTDRQMMAAGDYEHPTAKVWVDSTLVRNVIREFGRESVVRENPDGSAVFEVPCSNNYAFRLWLFAMTDKAVVLEPQEVRDNVVKWLDELTERA
ncbi:MAG: helix-turn-helix transcriptional regulator [Ilumatobacteraceae bacterium]